MNHTDFFRIAQNRAGIIEPGYTADLVLLGANPFESIDALDDIRGIVLRGKWIGYDEILEDVETRAAGYANAMAPYETFKEHLAAGRFDDAEAMIGTGDLSNERMINVLGYHYLGREDFDTAIAVFSMNVRAYPESANTYDSLGEAYMEAGQKTLAIENYEKSLELNPAKKNAVTMLKELRK